MAVCSITGEVEAFRRPGAAHAGGLFPHLVAEVPPLEGHPQAVPPHPRVPRHRDEWLRRAAAATAEEAHSQGKE